jgi:ABC-type polar amino acid transport system ATPase subunit
MSPPGPVVLEVDRATLRRGNRPILTAVSLQVTRGELVALMGPSGSGKTTMLRMIAGLDRFESGRISVDGVTLEGDALPTRATLAALRRKVGMVFQFHCLFDHLTAIENVCLAPIHALGQTREAASRRADQLLAAFGVDGRAGSLPQELSGGEAQRVAIARALAVDPQLLLMDEPTASLDPVRRAELGELLRGLIGEQRTLLVATHDEEFAHEFATRVVRLENGVVM